MRPTRKTFLPVFRVLVIKLVDMLPPAAWIRNVVMSDPTNILVSFSGFTSKCCPASRSRASRPKRMYSAAMNAQGLRTIKRYMAMYMPFDSGCQ